MLSNGNVIIAIYVDDMLLFGRSLKDIETVKAFIRAKFQAKDLGEAKVCLGIRITRDRKNRTLRIDQSAYTRNILRRFQAENLTSVSTPMETSAQSRLAEDGEDFDAQRYQQAVGGLMHLLHTRPELTFAVGKVCQYSAKPWTNHWTAVVRIFRYIKPTIAWGIEYGAERGTMKVVGYSDSDYAGDKRDRKSTMGYVFVLGGGAIAWSSQKVKSVTTSTTEAEYMGLGHATKHAIWTRKLLADAGQDEGEIIVLGDNEPSLNLVRNPGYHARSKHIDIQYHFVHDELEKGTVKFEYCPSEDMLADGMTKPLARPAFEDQRRRLGIVEVSVSDHGQGQVRAE